MSSKGDRQTAELEVHGDHIGVIGDDVVGLMGFLVIMSLVLMVLLVILMMSLVLLVLLLMMPILPLVLVCSGGLEAE